MVTLPPQLPGGDCYGPMPSGSPWSRRRPGRTWRASDDKTDEEWAPPTPGSSCTSCWATRRPGTTTGPGPNAAVWSEYPSKRTSAAGVEARPPPASTPQCKWRIALCEPVRRSILAMRARFSDQLLNTRLAQRFVGPLALRPGLRKLVRHLGHQQLARSIASAAMVAPGSPVLMLG